MFKKLLIDTRYSFSNDQISLNGQILTNTPKTLTVTISGIEHRFDTEWLRLLAHYEVNFLRIQDLKKIYFTKCISKVMNIKCSKLMNFRNSVKINGMYVIPGFTHFRLTENGEVFSFKTNKGRKLKTKISYYGYPYVNLYDPDKNRWRSVCLHILIARVFICNPDPGHLVFVNHINGNKRDYSIQNLEWVDSLRNVQHAVLNNLNTQSQKCEVFDSVTKTVIEYPSISAASRVISDGHTFPLFEYNNEGIKIPFKCSNRFEVREKDSDLQWQSVASKDYFSVGKSKIEKIIVRNINTLNDDILLDCKKVSKKYGIPLGYVYKEANRYDKTPRNDLIFLKGKNLTEGYSIKESFIEPKIVVYSFVNNKTSKQYHCKSKRKVEKITGVSRKYLKKYFSQNKIIGNWTFSQIENV